jgi:hypothetical protein
MYKCPSLKLPFIAKNILPGLTSRESKAIEVISISEFPTISEKSFESIRDESFIFCIIKKNKIKEIYSFIKYSARNINNWHNKCRTTFSRTLGKYNLSNLYKVFYFKLILTNTSVFEKFIE